MKKHLIAAVCSLAVLMTAAPMIAACNPQTDDETAMETPVLPGLPETPENELPVLPETPEEDRVPEESPEETPGDTLPEEEEEDVPAVSLRAQYVRVRTDST